MIFSQPGIARIDLEDRRAYCACELSFPPRKDSQDARKTKWMAAFPPQNSEVCYVEVQVTELLRSASTNSGAK